MFCRASLVLSFISVLVSAALSSDEKCKQCDAYGELREPNKAFTHTENCRQMLCKCNCNGDWECPPDRSEIICEPSNPQCGTCWAGGAMREGNRDFTFTEGCFQYNCFCNCDGAWNCPSEKTINTCNYNVTSGCYYCDVYGVKYNGGSNFKHVNGCIEYDCKCNCDGSWNCPGERAVDTCNRNQETGCYYCDVYGKKYEGNSHFKHVNGCIEFKCSCNCDGSWNCPGEQAVDTCRTNPETGCYYCDVNSYMYEGNSRFPLIENCFLYECECACDGGWTCKNSIGKYICDTFGNEPVSECRSCDVDGNPFRGESRFFYKKGCITYKCSCDCAGRYYCSGNDAFYTCAGYEGQAIASLSSSYSYVYRPHTRSPRQVTGCLQCVVDGKTYDTYQTFNKQSGCNLFTCTCQCDGTPNCLEQYINICAGPTGGGSGASTFGSEVSPDFVDYGTGVNVCTDCNYRGITYEGNSPFSFDSGCWKYNCNCYCNGSISCPSDRSKYICPGRTECIKCKVDDRLIEPNTDFQLRRGCVSYKRCSCSCDGGWNCEDGEYTCDLCQSCKVDGQTYAGNSTFQLTRGCDRYKNCYCGCDAKWQCSGEVEDLCGACRKCKIGDDYYDGETAFQAQVLCTKYRRCECNCDGSYKCVRGSFTCGERGDMPIVEQCPDCVHGGRRYRPDQTFDYEDSCVRYKSCKCHCGKTSCREVEDKCGNCRSCLVESMEHRGGTKFSMKNGCLHYKECDCFCSGNWKCYGKSAVDTCNTCKKCNVDDVIHEPYSRFSLDRDCWKYHCFCGCNGSTNCPSQTAVNTCTQPDVCYSCEVGNKEYPGNTLFSFEQGGMVMSCKCNCDGSYYCIAEWLYIKTNLTISGDDLGGCFYCYLGGGRYPGDTKFSLIENDIEMNCQCFCNGGYYCYGERKYESTACRGCRVYGLQHPGGTDFSIVYNGFKLACQCSCDGTYLCYGTEGTAVISCISGVGCLSQTCGQCIVQGKRFDGGDVFATTYKGREVRCDCGCDGSYYCEGSGGIILSCVNGICREYGCSSCQVFDLTREGDTTFEIIYKGLKLDCQCECGGNYQCRGASGNIVVSCIDNGGGCLTGTCGACQVENRRVAGRSTFRYVYNGIDMMCTCSCDSSYYCIGVYEEIEISCIGGSCSRLGCNSCNVYGMTHPGDSSFDMIYGGLKLDCRCECSSDYICQGSDGITVISCLNGRNCLPATCGSCYFNNREYPGRSTYRSVYKGIDVLCTCGCDSSSYCKGTTTSIEVTCIGGSCSRIGCRECSIFGIERPGSSQFDIIYEGIKLACECDCDGGYICRGGTGVAVITCVNGVGPGCLNTRCQQCLVDNNSYEGFSKFDYIFQGIDMECTCSCDGSYYCTGVSELIEVSCFGGTCTPIGCKKCQIYGRQIDGASPFQIVYGGNLLDCMCSCDGSYKCLGDRDNIVIQCRYNGNCVSSRCQQCVFNNQRHEGGTSFRDVYNGIDVTCTCGCDSSYICAGISSEFKVSCVGGQCNVIGCQACNAYGRTYTSFEKFEVIYRGMRLGCECDCDGGYICTGTSGEVFVRCRNDGRNCLPAQCGTCMFDGRFAHGESLLRYNYKGIDMSCICGCDGSVFCEGVSEQIDLWCVDGTCIPSGCRPCSVYGREIDPLTTFNIIHRGMRLDCTCACDSSFECLSKKKEKIITCPAGQGSTCLSSRCQDCIVSGLRREARTIFPYVYEGIDMKCNCGCDGTAYCEGVRYDIIISCIGGTCSPRDCQSCNIFGESFPAYKPFSIVHEGYVLDCTCACDSSFVCRGKNGNDVINCRPGERCLATTCQDCIIDGVRRSSRSTFPYVYEDIDMNCRCGCDGSAYCEGLREEIILSCISGSCSVQGCRTCTIFGQSHPAYRPFQIVHEGDRLDCTCACDSSFVCRGKTGNNVINCRPGERCLATTCRDCIIDGVRRSLRSTFPYMYKDIDMECTCGCDGSAYCEGVREEIIVSCIDGSCSHRGCRDCTVFGKKYPSYKPFQTIYQGTQLDCTCACDSSFICYGEGKPQVSCRPGQTCPFNQRCTDCLVGGKRRKSWSVFAYQYEGIDMKCSCGCDGTAYCEGVREEIILSCIGGSCAVKGCQRCSVFGSDQEAYKPFNIVYQGVRIDCTCKCDASFVCVGKSGEKVIDCRPGENCLDCSKSCVVDGQRYRPRSTFPYRYNNIEMMCTCGCDASAFCEGVTQVYYVSCIGERCFRAGCQNCNLFGEDYSGDAPFDIVHKGIKMDCDCHCDSSWRCEGKGNVTDIDCQAGRICLPKRCKKCRVGKRRYNGRESFQFDYKNTRMNCVCGCDGTYYCKGVSSDYEISCPRRGPCTQVGGCRKCNIFGSEYYGGSRNEFVYQGYFMTCTCDCDSSYKCLGTRGELVVECGIDKLCLINKCGPCRVDGKTIRGGSVFDKIYQNRDMQCTCGCDGSYFCKCKDDDSELSCDARDSCTQLGCATCISDGNQRQVDEEFEKFYDGIRMNCICNCDGSYRCKGDDTSITIICTRDSCNLVGCRSCLVDGKEYPTGTDFDVTENRQRKRCRCECSGSATCQDVTRPSCVACLIDGKTYPGHSRNRVYRNGQPFICDCLCSGKSECNPEGPACRECNIFGQRSPGNREFETVYEGTRMNCKCDCSGSFECRGGGRVCTSASGCQDTNTCPGCEIEGRTYPGGTNFDIFHNGYGINMNCNCQCGGSYKCQGTKSVTPTCIEGDCSNTCLDCTFNGQTHRGNSVFDTTIDNIPMRCTCHCTGGYSCEGYISDTKICQGADCFKDGCRNCKLEGKLYPPNTEFEFQSDRLTLQCSCACNGTLVCLGQHKTEVCIGSGCDTSCRSCNFEGNTLPGNSRFQTLRNGKRQICTCNCNGRLTCEARDQCTGPGCQTTGCRRCIIDGQPFTGNTRFAYTKGSLAMNCSCYCDGTYSCRNDDTGFEYSCLGNDCPADICRPCELDGQNYQLDDKFRLSKNALEMNCVCECDGAYRCFSISGYCTGPDCDDFGCSSCIIGSRTFKGNSRFELKPGTLCECDCNGEYRCNTGALGFKCIGANCGIGSCKSCRVDNDIMIGDDKFQFKKYGLSMNCACNCDSTYTCRGYQIISDGSGPVDIPCVQCVISGQKYNPMTRFQTIIDGERKECSCDCRGQHSCSGIRSQCRNCIIGINQYQSDTDFTLYKQGQGIRCRCGCNGDFVCEGQGTCQGGECGGCRDCLIFGTRHKGGSRFYTGSDPQLLCDCSCTGEYICKGYRTVAKVFLAPEVGVEATCASCYVADNEHPGNTNFKIRRGCYVVDCICSCSGEWECPEQQPDYVCDEEPKTERVYYSLAGTIGSVNEPIKFSNTRATLVYRDETSSSIFGKGGGEDCNTCIINKQKFDGNTAFILQDGCLRWSCLCNCNGGWTCSSVVGTDCTGPLDPFEGKTCTPCKAYGKTYAPEQQFSASDECYRYTCTCNCDGSYECPPELTIKTCPDSSQIYNEQKDTCRQCEIGTLKYDFGAKFEYVFDCIRYICDCRCDGSYFCPSSTGIRVCRTGSGSPGRFPVTGSQTVTKTKTTYVALRPSGTGTAGGSQSTLLQSGSRGSSVEAGGFVSSGGFAYGSEKSDNTISSGVNTRYSNGTQSGSDTLSRTETSYQTSRESVAGTGTATGGSSYQTGYGQSEYSGGGGGQSGSSRGSVITSYQTGGSSTGYAASGSTHESGLGDDGRLESSSSSSSSSSSEHSYSSSSGSSGSTYRGGARYVPESGSAASQAGSSCRTCIVNGDEIPGGRDFTYRNRCIEYNCECRCDGTHSCPENAQFNFCEREKSRTGGAPVKTESNEGCTIGDKTYKTQLFTHTDTEKCIKYVCRCYKNGAHYCDPNQTKRVC